MISTPLRALFDLALERRVVVEDVAHEAGAARQGHELALEADQAARRDAVLEAHAALAVGLHVDAARRGARPSASMTAPWCCVLDVDREQLDTARSARRRSP